MDQNYQSQYRELHAKHWWWRAREAAIIRLIRTEITPLLSERVPIRILEIGSASGLNFHLFKKFGSVSGVEIDKNWENDLKINNHEVWFGDFLEFPASNNSYDVIVALDVIEHISEEEKVLRKIHEILTPNGLFLVNVPAWNILWTKHDDMNYHFRRYTPNQLRYLAKNFCFELLVMRSLFLWPAIAKFILHLKEKLHFNEINSDFKLPGIPPRIINGILKKWAEFENILLEHLPAFAGSSLLALYRCKKRNDCVEHNSPFL